MMGNRIRTLGLVAVGLLAACAGGGEERGASPGTEAGPAVDVARTSEPGTDVAEGGFAWLAPRGAARAGATARDAAWATLRAIAPRYRLSTDALAATTLAHLHDAGDGPIVAQFVQRVDGLEVFQRRMRVALARDLTPVAASGRLASTARPRAAFTLDAARAGRAALAALTGLAAAPASVGAEETQGEWTTLRAAGTASARAKKVWFADAKGLTPAFYVELDAGTRATSFVVSAEDGALLFRNELTRDHAYRVWADPETFRPMWGPQGLTGSPHPAGRPNGFQAAFVARPLVTLDHLPFSKNDPWLPAGAMELSGNNALAYADLTRPDGFGTGDYRAASTDGRKFDFPFDTARGPQVNDDAKGAVTTALFYMMNYLHDSFYDAGFDEASGNCQEDNFGRGGQGGDRILAEAQDYSGRNNANASTPADGAPPRIQMFLFDGEGRTKVTSGALSYTAKPASFSPPTFSLSGALALVDDGQGASPNDGCEAPFANAAALAGKIALVDRGTCSFAQKVSNAQAAGARGVVVANNVAGGAPSLGAAQGTPQSLPAVGVSQADGAALKQALLAGAVTVTLTREESIDRDGALDGAIVSHEWGHVLSNRLVGDANGLSNSQGVGMGEGWADFTSLVTLVREDPAKRYDGAYAVGGYVMSGGDNDGYYFGVRRYPYSIDKTKNPLTFQHIADGTRLPATAPLAFGEEGADNSEVHNTGEIWASMLWECYAALLRDPRYTYAQAQDRMKRYLVASLKLTPEAPTMLEARDAVLAAAYATDAKDFELFAAAFARRGAGVGAEGPDRRSTSHAGVKESAAVGNDVSFVSAVLDDGAASCDKDGVLDVGEKGTLTLTLRNTGTGNLTATRARVTASDPGVRLENGGVVTFGEAKPYATMAATLGVELGAAKPVSEITFTVAVEDATLAVPRPVGGALSAVVQYDVREKASATDDVEAPVSTWKNGSDKRFAQNETWRREAEGANHVWTIANNDTVSDQWLTSPAVEAAADAPLVVSFRHRWSFEVNQGKYYDGGVVEISADGGKTWTDVGERAKPGYIGQLETAQSDNPLKGRSAFVGRSSGFPANMVETTLDFGAAYAGKTVQLRFRVGTDEGTAATGWTIDDIAFKGIVGTPFAVRVADNCGRPAPTGPGATTPAGDPAPTAATANTLPQGGAGSSDGGCAVAPAEGGRAGGFGAALGALLGIAAFARRRRR